ncbi:MAG: glycosyltransferase family 9 protein [Gammaproteobacteria bacterium]|nr:glycosyltransferase family 9 protein [Gammaproteobacteria bacterium]MCH9744358.1 glycosyltransferase family 9 protein [Gammaproteobacteria bacterium]
MNILFISNTRLGDAILSTGILNHLLQQYPDAQFTIACGKPAASIFENFPNLHKLHIVIKKPHHRHWFKLWRQCCTTKWHTVVDLRFSGISYFLWAKNKYRTRPRQYHHQHRQQSNAALLKLNHTPELKIWSSQQNTRDAEQKFKNISNKETVIAVSPAANWQPKTWPIENFATLIEKLTCKEGPYPDATIAISASPAEYPKIKSLMIRCNSGKVIDLIHDLPILSVAECFKRCHLFIGNDSGLMHLATAVGTPVIGLFGPSNDKHYAPLGPNCHVIRTPLSYESLRNREHLNKSDTPNPMQTLTVDAVLEGVIRLKDDVQTY